MVMSDIEGKATTAAASELGSERVTIEERNFRPAFVKDYAVARIATTTVFVSERRIATLLQPGRRADVVATPLRGVSVIRCYM
jgi:hypothetical protein